MLTASRRAFVDIWQVPGASARQALACHWRCASKLAAV